MDKKILNSLEIEEKQIVNIKISDISPNDAQPRKNFDNDVFCYNFDIINTNNRHENE